MKKKKIFITIYNYYEVYSNINMFIVFATNFGDDTFELN